MSTNPVSIKIEVDPDNLVNYPDEHLAALWYAAQANPEPAESGWPGRVAEEIGREIIVRWIRDTPIPVWNHQGRRPAPAPQDPADNSLEARLARINGWRPAGDPGCR